MLIQQILDSLACANQFLAVLTETAGGRDLMVEERQAYEAAINLANMASAALTRIIDVQVMGLPDNGDEGIDDTEYDSDLP